MISTVESNKRCQYGDQIVEVYIDGVPCPLCVAIVGPDAAVVSKTNEKGKPIIAQYGFRNGLMAYAASEVRFGKVTWQTNDDIKQGREPHQ